VITDDMNRTETGASDEARVARRRVVQAAAALSVAGGVAALTATKTAQPAQAQGRGHGRSNMRHHSHTDRNGEHHSHFAHHNHFDRRLHHGHFRRGEDILFYPLSDTGGPYNDLMVWGDDEGVGHVSYHDGSDGHIHHHEVHPEDHSMDKHTILTEGDPEEKEAT
jgi:hypothetical protein